MEHFDVVIIGSGSGNSLIDERFDGLRVAMVERGVYGGTCLNVGCIPTKMFVLPADHAVSPEQARRINVDLRLGGVDFPAIRDRVFGRIDPISAGGRQWREQSDNVTVFTGSGRFVDKDVLEIALQGEDEPVRISGDRFVLAAGSRATLLDVPGAEDPLVAPLVHTSDTIMRLPELPQSMIILGGGYIAAEFAHVFSAYGVEVTMINRSERLLRREDDEVSERFTKIISGRVALQLNQRVTRLEATDGQVTVFTEDPNGIEYDHTAELVLVAFGRVPNADGLDLDKAGVTVDEDGYVVVDEHQRTSQPHIWALGDVCSRDQLKHVANHEMRVVQANLLHEITGEGAVLTADHRHVPHAIFTEPQIASVGLTERELQQAGTAYLAKVQAYGDVAYGWALEDQQHFVKLLSDPRAERLLGAHIIGPQASTLIQPIIQAMSFGLGIREMARGQYWIHPALTEVVENALLGLVEQADAPAPSGEPPREAGAGQAEGEHQ
ncbi:MULTISPECIES: mycothione reductase [unclassified Luteococcus]|uniref:mycothione reductase n=1 Tax=unclassified Luteococcus TaxID=2639923 RepID=UPI00313B9D8B